MDDEKDWNRWKWNFEKTGRDVKHIPPFLGLDAPGTRVVITYLEMRTS